MVLIEEEEMVGGQSDSEEICSNNDDEDENRSSGDEGDIVVEEESSDDEIQSDDEEKEASVKSPEQENPPNPPKLSKAELRRLKKIAPQRQKKLIHTLFKRAKIYEIRKLSRRISTLKSAKGTEEQLAKNQRKAERLSKEIECMREFMIDKLVDRSIAVFKGKAESFDMDLWESCQTPSKTNDMIQVLSEKESDHLQDIAYLRMLSSKDIVGKFQRISQGENLLSRRQKKKKKSKGKASKSDQAQNDEAKETDASKSEFVAKKSNSKPKQNINAKKSTVNKTADKTDTGVKPKPKKMKRDSFFVDHEVEGADSSDNESIVSNDDEFSAPVKFDTANPAIRNPKKNRMGQRERRKLQDKKYGREPQDRKGPSSRGRGNNLRGSYQSRGGGRSERGQGRGDFRGGRGRGRGSFNANSRSGRQASFGQKPQAVKKVDENLHPSWQAKQKLKAQQTISGFSGTKITFDDD